MIKKMVLKNLKRIINSYFKRCPYCGYAGSDWPDSGECPNCGETS